MKIGITGAGRIGGTLTRRLTEPGHEVYVANSRGPTCVARRSRQGNRCEARPGRRGGTGGGGGCGDHP
jgi:predicted dinucleotide-binding enzyme